VTTLPEGGSIGASPLSSYRFALNLPMLTPPYFTELHVNTLLPSPPGTHRRGLFYADSQRKLLALELGAITVQGFTAVFTLHTLYVPHDALLSYIAAHPAPHSDSDDTVEIPWEAWGPSHTRIVTVPNVAHSRYLGLHKVCGMHALSEPPILFERGILRIMDYRSSCAPPPLVAEQEGGDPVSLADGIDTEEPRGASGTSGDDVVAKNQASPRVSPPPSSPSPPPPLPDTSIPYRFKDISLPKGLETDSVRCVLGEDVVVLFEVGASRGACFGWPLTLRSLLGAAPNSPVKE
jgi:hypothetical protein